ncbi:hypothetical protein [Mesorhizobium sp. 10J20-29]
MLEQLTNDGLAYWGNPTPVPEVTVIIIGPPRSGTTMPAATLHHLGVFMGAEVGTGVFEDRRIAKALEKSPEELPQVIADYNTHSIWGFKRPMAFGQIERNLNLFRNPRFVVTFRDPIAIAKRNEVSMGKDFAEQFKAAIGRTNQIANFIGRQTVPVMGISYEKAVSAPESFTRSLAEFACLKPTDAEILEASRFVRNGPDEYLMASQTRFSKRGS